ncbi:hypothetical protein SAMN05216525_103350 [Bradyrhizobium sp. Gha]|nr:hypothetical protein SAMN05216525_103350 [Bradyrhizobium sp. Gha]
MVKKERKTGVQTESEEPWPGARTGPLAGIRHTALAAKNDLERWRSLARGGSKKN